MTQILTIVEDSRANPTSHYVSDPQNRFSGTATITPSNIQLPLINPGQFLLPDPIYGSWKYPLRDNESFSKIRRSGRIKMTRYSVGKTTTTFFPLIIIGKEVTVSGSFQIQVPYWGGSSAEPGSTFNLDFRPGYPPYTRYSWTMDPHHVKYRIDEQKTIYDLSRLDTVDTSVDPNLATEIESLKSDLSTAFHKRWDVMTDVFEGKATLNMIRNLLSSARSPLKTYKDLKDRLKKNPIKGTDKEIRQNWLGLRYGILPTMYSIQDLVQLASESKHEYLTERRRATIDLQNIDPPQRECLYIRRTGTIQLNGTAKGRFSSTLSRFSSGTSLNVINSAWEVIPYSLVVDWFANVGDYLYNQTSSWVPSTVDSSMCYTVKKRITTSTFARIKQPDGSYADTLVRTDEEESYERYPFNQSDIKLVFNPKFSSAKRWFDAYALSVGPLTKALRRLR